jgi:hypothetical protein
MGLYPRLLCHGQTDIYDLSAIPMNFRETQWLRAAGNKRNCSERDSRMVSKTTAHLDKSRCSVSQRSFWTSLLRRDASCRTFARFSSKETLQPLPFSEMIDGGSSGSSSRSSGWSCTLFKIHGLWTTLPLQFKRSVVDDNFPLRQKSKSPSTGEPGITARSDKVMVRRN